MNLAVSAAARRRDASMHEPSHGVRSSSRSFSSIWPASPIAPRGSGDRGPAVLPDRRRQDRSLSRSRGLRHRAATAEGSGRAWRRRRGDHALYAAAADARPALSRRRRRLRARADADRSGQRRRERPPTARRLADRDRPVGRVRCLAEPPRRPRRRRSDHGGRSGPALQDGAGQACAGAAEGVPLVRHGIHAAVVLLRSERYRAEQHGDPLR